MKAFMPPTLVLTMMLAGCSGSNEPQGGGGAPSGCAQLTDCVANCAEGDSACLDECAAQASPAAITSFNALVDCLIAANCADEACAEASCAAELTDCAGQAGAQEDGGTSSGSYTTTGKCEISVEIPLAPPMRTCWDYTLTASGNHNDGTEHYVYYDATSAASGQQTCADSAGTFTGGAGGIFDAQEVSNANAQNKQLACSLSGNSGATATFTAGAACSFSGSLGHCTHQITNVYDASSGTVTATTATQWAVP